MFRFSYALKRDYPYSWLTPAVAAGTLVAAAVILFINIITQSYDLVATSTNNISGLKAQNPFAQQPLLAYLVQQNNNKASCDAATIPINSEIWTKNYALPYTVTSVWREYGNGTMENQGALVYLDNMLLDCNVTGITILVNGKYSQTPLLSARSRVGLVIKPQATCAIQDDDTPVKSDQKGDQINGMTFFSLQGAYNIIDSDIPNFLLSNATTSPSLFWGRSLLALYYLVTSHAYWEASLNSDWGSNGSSSNTYSAYFQLSRQSNATVGTADEVMSDNFFSVECDTEDNFCQNTTIPALSQGSIGAHGVGTGGSPYPSIWSAINVLGKAMWFTTMTDLGQNNTVIPNMLAYPDLLANLTSNVTNEANAWVALQNSGARYGSVLRLDTDLMTQSFDPSATPVPALGTQASYLSTNYVCQIPKPKSAGTRVIAILTASLVLLQTVWNGFFFAFDWIIFRRRKDPSDAFCEGCIANHAAQSVQAANRNAEVSGEKGIQTWGRKDYTQVNQMEQHSE
ncbi:hypothetical protein F5Y16DRAFT_389539 [Xylariaceae sp. FL0255]|nr:hypothetical protein F5Y16DRAFT_389539 [Xylariaceae sp. FL0255]